MLGNAQTPQRSAHGAGPSMGPAPCSRTVSRTLPHSAAAGARRFCCAAALPQRSSAPGNTFPWRHAGGCGAQAHSCRLQAQDARRDPTTSLPRRAHWPRGRPNFRCQVQWAQRRQHQPHGAHAGWEGVVAAQAGRGWRGRLRQRAGHSLATRQAAGTSALQRQRAGVPRAIMHCRSVGAGLHRTGAVFNLAVGVSSLGIASWGVRNPCGPDIEAPLSPAA
jgi:hypothetical protein